MLSNMPAPPFYKPCETQPVKRDAVFARQPCYPIRKTFGLRSVVLRPTLWDGLPFFERFAFFQKTALKSKLAFVQSNNCATRLIWTHHLKGIKDNRVITNGFDILKEPIFELLCGWKAGFLRGAQKKGDSNYNHVINLANSQCHFNSSARETGEL